MPQGSGPFSFPLTGRTWRRPVIALSHAVFAAGSNLVRSRGHSIRRGTLRLTGQGSPALPVCGGRAPPVAIAHAAWREATDSGEAQARPQGSGFDSPLHLHWIAQSVEQRTRNAQVAGSTPAPTMDSKSRQCRSQDHPPDVNAAHSPLSSGNSSAAATRAPGKRGCVSTVSSRHVCRLERAVAPGPGTRCP
jgi:hypothetical protein